MNPYMDKYMRVVRKEMDRYGFDLTIVRNEGSTYDTATGAVVETLVEYPCRGIIFDLTLQSNGSGTSRNSLITNGDKQLFIQPPDDDGFYYENELELIKPERDHVVIADNVYKVITFKQINPSTSDSVLFDCYIRA